MTTIVTVAAPKSKSLSHRALIGAALARGTCRMGSLLVSEDIARTRQCLEAAGAEIRQDGDGMIVRGMRSGPEGGEENPLSLFMNESGTSCRLLTGIMAAGLGKFRVHGAPRMHERPIGALARSLSAAGVKFEYEGTPDCPPFVMTTEGLPGGKLDIDIGESSQYLSGLLLAAPLAASETTITVIGEKVVSWPYVALTLETLRHFQVPFRVETLQDGKWVETDYRAMTSARPNETRFVVQPSGYTARDWNVEGDWSNASYLVSAGAVGRAPVKVCGLSADSLQGDRVILDILEKMGAKIEWDGDAVTVFPSSLKGVEVDMGACPDIVPTVGVVAAMAEGPTTITNVAHLKIKECDRLNGLAEIVTIAGHRAEVMDDAIRIIPGTMATEPVTIPAYGDHRMAMAPSLFRLKGLDSRPDDPSVVGKSFPDFWEEWAKIEAGMGLG